MHVGRFAPTPSGYMHLGNAWAAILAWAAAQSCGGHVILRIDDLDTRARGREELTAQLISDLTWLGLTWEGEPIYQSQRQASYQAALDSLSAQGLIYPCFCRRADLHAADAPHASDGTPIYAGTCAHLSPKELEHAYQTGKVPAFRLRMPKDFELSAEISFTDVARGTYRQNLAREVGDFIVQRSDGVFAYQLACAVDDGELGVTQVTRGGDLLSSTPRQIYIQKLLGLPTPTYIHIPLLMAPDGHRLSKRNLDRDLKSMRADGVQPESVWGEVAHLLGYVDKNVPLSKSEFMNYFDLEQLKRLPEEIMLNLDS